MRRRVIFLMIFIVAINISVYFLVKSIYNNELFHHNHDMSEKFLLEYNTIIKDFNAISDFIFDAYITDNKYTLEKLYQGIIDKKDTEKVRKGIYEKFFPIFEKIKQKGYSQIHFIDYNGNSFLRMHLPDTFGDDLKPFRKLLVKALDEKRKISGLEVGRHEIAYRIDYPIFYKGKFLGILELALNSEFIIDYMNRELNGSYYIIINKESVKSMKEEFFKKKYYPIRSFPDFYINSKVKKQDFHTELEEIFENRQLSLLPPQQKTYNFKELSIFLVPLYEFNNNFIGYALKIEHDYFPFAIKRFRIINLSLFFILSLVLMASYIIIDNKNIRLSKELMEKDTFAKKLNELNRLYEIILKNSDQIVYDYNVNKDEVRRSGAIEKILHIDEKQFVKSSINEFEKLIHPEDFLKVHSFIKQIQKNDTTFDIRYRLKKGDGTYAFIHDQGVATIIDGERHILGTMKDVSSVVKYEEVLQQAQRLESIGVLAGGIAHDFNNLLAGMWNYIEMIKISKDPDIIDKCIEKARTALDRAKALTSQLLTFSKGGQPNIKVVDIRNVIYNIVPFSLSGSALKYTIEISDDVKNCLADEHQISQVIENIIINARQAMSNKGDIFVKVDQFIQKEDNLNHIHLPKGEYIKISIIDTGPGISEENLKKIFEPFFTTKKDGKGLGLAICYNIIKKHNGYINVSSKIGEGTEVDIYLPATSQIPEEKGQIKSEILKENLNIILMDDEELILDSSAIMLETLGHKVYTCRKGEEVIEKYLELKNQGINVDLFILDITIVGGMGGIETIKRLKAIDNEIKAIVSSGYADDPVFATYKDYGFCAALKKPYGLDEMTKVMKESLI